MTRTLPLLAIPLCAGAAVAVLVLPGAFGGGAGQPTPPPDGAAAAASTATAEREVAPRQPVQRAAEATAAAPAKAKPKPKPKRQDDAIRVALPIDSPFDLPPIVRLKARAVKPQTSSAVLRRMVLRTPKLALAPNARRNIERGEVGPAAMRLLLERGRLGAPLLVFSASGRSLRVQETNLVFTRRTLHRLELLPKRRRPASIRFEAPPIDSTGVKLPPGADLGERAVKIAMQFLGVPYVWGGETPSGFDCSGLTMYAYRQLGVGLHHWTGFQFYEGTRIPSDRLKPGDLVFFRNVGGIPGHVGMYIGNGQMVHAPHTGDVVRVVELFQPKYAAVYAGAVRPY